MTIYLLRHGQAITNIEKRISGKRPEGGLTDLGREQARNAGNYLRDKDITSIRTSPFDRTQQTARIVGEYLDLIPTLDDDLREVDGGEYDYYNDERSWAKWHKIYSRWKQGDSEATFPGGESYKQGYDRFYRALLNCDADENTVLVAHAAIIRTVVPYLCVNAAALQNVKAPHNCGLVVLSYYDAHRFECEAWDLHEFPKTN